MCQLEVVVGEAALGMGGENQRHLVPTNVDVWMVVHQLGLMPDLIHKVQGRNEVGQLKRRGNRRLIAFGTTPVRQSRQLPGHFGICQEWTHNLSQGAPAWSVKRCASDSVERNHRREQRKE